MSHTPVSSPQLSRRAQLVGGAWLGHLLLVWLLACPLYQQLGSSSLLQGARGDESLFTDGAETLLALLAARSHALADAQRNFWQVGILCAIAGVACSSYVWVALDSSAPLFGKSLRVQWWRVLPAFALTAVGALASAAFLGWSCWQMLAVCGALLEPGFGERVAVLFYCGMLLCLLGGLAWICVLADTVRAVLACGAVRPGQAFAAAFGLFWQQPLRISLNALLRIALVLSLQLTCSWLVLHFHMLSRSNAVAIAAMVQAETAALLAVALRLDWIAWILRLARKAGE